MSQHDMVLENAKGAAFRADLNTALAALVSTSSGPTAPSVTFANMLWYDETAHALKMRNEADDAWITLLDLDQSEARVTNLTTTELYGHISGLTIANSSPDTDHDVLINPGTTIDVNNKSIMTLSSVLVKRIDSSWGVGHGAGGLDTGTVAADTAYAVWLIRRSDTGVVDALFSTSFTSSGVTLPTNYNELQLIGWVATDSSSNIYAFVQRGSRFELEKAPLVLTDSSITDGIWETATITELPPECVAEFTANIYNNYTIQNSSNTTYLWLRPYGAAKTTTNYNGHVQLFAELDSSWGMEMGSQVQIAIDGSQRFEYAASEAFVATHVRFHLIGCTLTQRGHAS